MKVLLAVLFSLLLFSGKLSAQEVKPLTLPKVVTAQNKELPQSLTVAHNFMEDFKTNCAVCDLEKAKYYAMIKGVPYMLNSSKPLPFPTKWVKEANIKQKVSGYEVVFKFKERKEQKALELMQTKLN